MNEIPDWMIEVKRREALLPTDPDKPEEEWTLAETANSLCRYLHATAAMGAHCSRRTLKEGEFITIEDFVLEHGTVYEPSPRPDWCEQGELKMCYGNAFNHAIARSDVTYVEGYAVNMIPCMHAWLIDADGNVIDPTWTTGKVYFGVPFNTAFIRTSVLLDKVYGIFGGAGRTCRDLLRGKFSEVAWKP